MSTTTISAAFRDFVSDLLELAAPLPELLGPDPGATALALVGGDIVKINSAEFMLDGSALRTADFEITARGARMTAVGQLLADGDDAAYITLEGIAAKLAGYRVRPNIDLGEKRTALRLYVTAPPTASSASGATIKYTLRCRLLYFEEGGVS